MSSFWQDVRYALRMLVKSRGFATVAILTLALGIGANTAMFSLVNAVMLRDLPVQKPSELVLFGTGRAAGSTDRIADTELYSYPFYRQMREKNQVFSELAAVMSLTFNKMHGAVAGSSTLESMDVQLASGSYFSLLGVKPALGETFTPADDAPAGAHPVAVISYSFWKRRLDGDASALGKTLTFGSTPYTIIGVAPPEFFGTTVGQAPDVWIPLSMEKQLSPGWNGLDNRQFESLYIIGRLKARISAVEAESDVNVIARELWTDFAGSVPGREQQEDIAHSHITLSAASRGISRLRYEFSKPLKLLTVVVALVLLIACANIANLLLARASNRQREIAVRMAIGAGRARLVRQMLTESLLLAFFGGALGLWFATWASAALLSMVSTASEPVPLNIAPDGRVFAFTLLVSLATVIFFGIAPALRTTTVHLAPALKEGKGAGSGAGRTPTADALIVTQVALSLVLLIGAGLFLRTLGNLSNIDTGFDKNDVLLFGIDATSVGYQEDSRLVNLYRQLEQRVSSEPGVRSASVSFFTFNQGEWDENVTVQGSALPADVENDVTENVVGPEYFATMGIPLLVGRTFGPQDTATSAKVAVINETMATRFFPGGSPIGRRFGPGGDPKHSGEMEVIGVVKDAKYIGLRERLRAAAYYPYTQNVQYYYNLSVRYSGDRRAIIGEVREAVSEVDDRLPVVYESTLAEQVHRSVAGQGLIAKLSSLFAALAVFLACIGIYGLMSYAVARRTMEIGIRMALGAARADVLRMVMREVLVLVAIGFAIGVPAALGSGRWAASMLFGLKPSDTVTIAVAALVLFGVTALAGYLPARRAARVDPIVALRYE
jgi:predicted permease